MRRPEKHVVKESNELFPNAIEAFFLVVALYMAEYFLSMVAYDMRDTLALGPDDVGAIVMVLGSGVIFTFVMHHKSLTYRELFHSSSTSASAMAMILMPAIVLTVPATILVVTTLIDVALWAFPMSEWEAAMFESMESGSLAMVLYGCLIAPVLEEMLFRGIILRSFLRQYAKWTAILMSAVLFGLAHMNLYQFIVGLMLGMYLGWLYERTRSLLPCIGLHVVYNTTLTVMSGSASDPGDDSAGYWLCALLLAGAGTFMLRRTLIGRPVRQ